MDDKILNEVKKVLTDYLEKNNLRKTKQRYDIIDIIYTETEHFTIDELDFLIKSKNIKISRATLYNTIDLLEKLDLIKKHKFNSKISFYEKSYYQKKHSHLICKICGKIVEFCDPRIFKIEEDIGEYYKFDITESEIIFYGICEECKKKNNSGKKNNKKI